MHATRLLYGLASAGVLVSAACSSTLASAHAASQPGWRIVKAMTNCPYGSLTAVAATGPGDAWAMGQSNYVSSGSGCGADVEHWDGKTWRRIPVPGGQALGAPPGSPALAVNSPGNAWIFTYCAGDRPCTNALRWNGRAWQVSPLPARFSVTAAATLGPANTWAFGSIQHAVFDTTPYAAHYDGKRWHEIAVPVAPVAVSAQPRGGLWAVGPSVSTAGQSLAGQVFLAAHWTGRSWQTMPAPVTSRPSGVNALVAGYVAVAGPHDLWWAYQVTSGEPSPLGLHHWNGTTWTAIKLPSALAGIDAMTQDGNGGIWLIANVNDYALTQYWYHYSGGQWTRQIVPSQNASSPTGYNNMLFGMAWIPGTTSLLAVGEGDCNTGSKTEGVIARYGS